MINDLLLLSGNDIPFVEAQISIHQPTLKEISFIGEDIFFIGCEFLNFSKQKIKQQDKTYLKDFTDFEVFMKIMTNDDIADEEEKKVKIYVHLVLSLLFPGYNINFLPISILISKQNQQTKELERHIIDKDNFNIFKNIISSIFCLKMLFGTEKEYNPAGPQAKALVQKFKKRRQKLAELKGQKNNNISILSRYISILAVGNHKDINSLLQYTVYQLFDEFRRYTMKVDFDMCIQAKMAGAQNIEDVENWMNEIHSDIYKEDNFI